jgi:hypothetical protein
MGRECSDQKHIKIKLYCEKLQLWEWKSPLLVPEHFAHAVILTPTENVIEGHNILYFLLSCKVTMVYGPGEWTGWPTYKTSSY